ncbi:MAG: hypothetical protein CVT74_17925, partial [Alphaproteobacteria bacterium HGW-Alphaproteobacteria-13]
GRDTRDIATDTEWLTALDLFGMVTSRAVLLDTMTIEANLALPFTLSIDPVPEEIRRAVADLADEVGLGRERLSAAVQSLTPADRVRLHLARALAVTPQVLVLEHVTASLTPADATARLRLMLDLVPGQAGRSVADPYYGAADGFAVTWGDVDAVAAALVAEFAASSG